MTIKLLNRTTPPSLHWYDKKVLITGTGHSGTNIFTEVIKASDAFNFTRHIEDRVSWRSPTSGFLLVLTKNYGSKMACLHPYFHLEEFHANMTRFPNLYVLVCLRHPIDTVLSTIYRELPISMGGDSEEIKEKDVNINKQHIDSIIKTWKNIYIPTLTSILNRYDANPRVISARMENLIESPHVMAKNLAAWLGIEYKEEMTEPWGKVRHKRQTERYKGMLDKTQINNYKRWKELYGGFFADKGDLVQRLIDGFDDITKILGYTMD